jgi:hypothetical protein
LESETKPFNHTGHKEIWQWLSEDPGREKEDWPGWGDSKPIVNDCFACEYRDLTNNHRDCNDCPLIWPPNRDGSRVCDNDGGLWATWFFDAKTESERTKLAIAIRDVPVREGVECI